MFQPGVWQILSFFTLSFWVVIFWVFELSHLDFLSFVTFWVFVFCKMLSFQIVSYFEFFLVLSNLSCWVLSHFEVLSFVTFFVSELCNIYNSLVLSHFEFLSCQNLNFRGLSQSVTNTEYWILFGIEKIWIPSRSCSSTSWTCCH